MQHKPKLIALSTVALALGLVPADAQACSEGPTEGVFVRTSWDGIEIHPDGVVAGTIGAHDGDLSDALDEFTITVTHGGIEVPGTVELVEHGAENSSAYATAVLVWRPDVALEADTYLVTLEVSDIYNSSVSRPETTFSVVEGTAEAPDAGSIAIDPDVEVLSAGGFGPRVCCHADFGCGLEGESCRSLMERDQVTVSTDFDLGPQVGPYGYVRVLTGIDGVAEDVVAWLVPGESLEDGWRWTFSEQASRYCVAYEYISLLDGGTTRSDVACADHGDLLLQEYDVDLESWNSGCLEEPYWEDSGEPYIPDSDSAGSDTGDDSDTEEPPPTSDSQGSTASGGGETDGGGTDRDGEPGSDVDDSGCGCTTNDSGSGWLGLGFFGLLALLRRRQRTRS